MFGRAALVALIVLLVSPVAASEAWLQEGHDASRTGRVPGRGPAWSDVAWVVQLPGSRVASPSADASPLIVGDDVFVVTANYGARADLATNGVFAIAMSTGTARLVVELDRPTISYASDGERIFIVDDMGARAFSLANGQLSWTWPRLRVDPAANGFDCAIPTLSQGLLRVACTEVRGTNGFVFAGTVWVAALDASAGILRWSWVKDALAEATRPGQFPVPPPSVSTGVTATLTTATRLTTVGSMNLVVTLDWAGPAGPAEYSVWAIDDASGSLTWMRNSSHTLARLQGSRDLGIVGSSLPVGDEKQVFVRFEDLLALNPTRGTILWAKPVGSQDSRASESSSGFALAERDLFATSVQTIYRIDRDTGDVKWAYTLPPEWREVLGSTGLILTDDLLFARSALREPTSGSVSLVVTPAGNSIEAIDRESGNLAWRASFNMTPGPPPTPFGPSFTMSLSEGKLVVAGTDGTVRLFGRTPASLAVDAGGPERYPAPGETFMITISATSGRQGAPTEYRATWGDGSASDWTASPTFSHAYAKSGDFVARFEARNDAGQSSSMAVAMRVGGRPPNILETAFSAENQNLTLFVLGLAVTGAGGLFGVVQLRRKRRILARELSALEGVVEATKARPLDCDAALAERRARARGLLADGKLSDAQFAVLTNRIDELGRAERGGVVDSELAFLPHSLHEFLREILEDGRVSRWERAHFVEAVERDAFLTSEQKRIVIDRVDAWARRDLGEKSRAAETGGPDDPA